MTRVRKMLMILSNITTCDVYHFCDIREGLDLKKLNKKNCMYENFVPFSFFDGIHL